MTPYELGEDQRRRWATTCVCGSGAGKRKSPVTHIVVARRTSHVLVAVYTRVGRPRVHDEGTLSFFACAAHESTTWPGPAAGLDPMGSTSPVGMIVPCSRGKDIEVKEAADLMGSCSPSRLSALVTQASKSPPSHSATDVTPAQQLLRTSVRAPRLTGFFGRTRGDNRTEAV
ncbi:hypothetical protein Micbo1qcDRAFT_74440 [Microdochium bolleyi]|uniref:Uncharacterized protein n=1 Tax=Microdochium bolleyi TaxID=196109 RepID=A0A136IZ73_9PEZI|nr:hypothetical protein Micbo1qcDRAFT_74440 [Microdochium bolleyi]